MAGKVIEAVKAHRARVRVTEEWVRRVRVPDRATLLRGLRRTVLEPQQRLRLESERRLYVIADRSGLTIVRGNVFARKRNALRPPHGWVVVALGERRKGPLQPIVTIAGENP